MLRAVKDTMGKRSMLHLRVVQVREEREKKGYSVKKKNLCDGLKGTKAF